VANGESFGRLILAPGETETRFSGQADFLATHARWEYRCCLITLGYVTLMLPKHVTNRIWYLYWYPALRAAELRRGVGSTSGHGRHTSFAMDDDNACEVNYRTCRVQDRCDAKEKRDASPLDVPSEWVQSLSTNHNDLTADLNHSAQRHSGWQLD
jgi:hypothetical protein